MRTPEGGFADRVDLAAHAAALVERLRSMRPRVHCITNAVAQNFTANVLLAAGAIPSMTIAPDEVGAFAARADSLLVNLGTFDAERRAAADAAITQVTAEGKPWMLDPVLIDRSPPRAAYARSLVARRPAAIRLNETEYLTLAEAMPPEVFARAEWDRRRDHRGNRSRYRRRTGIPDRQRPSSYGPRDRHGLRGIGAGRSSARGRSPIR